MSALNVFLAALPILSLIVALTICRFRAWTAALSALAVGVTLALLRGTMIGVLLPQMGSGVLTGLYPIGLVIVGALYTYGVTVESGQFETMKRGLAGLSSDRRYLALLIVWGFGNFMEGMAGFGTAVAIPCAILVGVGFDPLRAVLCCLVANTVPTAFGSVGVPTLILAQEAGVGLEGLVKTVALVQIAVLAAGPFLVLFLADGLKGVRTCWKLALLADAAFLMPYLVVAMTMGPELPDVVGGLSVLLALGLAGRRETFDVRVQLRAWAPFGFVVVLLALLAIVPRAWKPTPGVVILAGATFGALVQGLRPVRLVKLFAGTVRKYFAALATICLVLALAKAMEASGMISDLAGALVSATGRAYAFFAPCVGGLGGFVTGSGTSTCVLFGKLQASIGAGFGRETLFAAANVMGAGIGKMVCPQSIVLGCATAGLAGRESEVLRRIFPYFLAVLLLACLCVLVA